MACGRRCRVGDIILRLNAFSGRPSWGLGREGGSFAFSRRGSRCIRRCFIQYVRDGLRVVVGLNGTRHARTPRQSSHESLLKNTLQMLMPIQQRARRKTTRALRARSRCQLVRRRVAAALGLGLWSRGTALGGLLNGCKARTKPCSGG
jgi:hypothetical protein